MDEASQAKGMTADVGTFEKLSVEYQVLYVTTTGRISGQPRQIEIWFVAAGEKLYILAEHYFDTQWVRNIAKNSRVRIRIGDREFQGEARILTEDMDSASWNLVRELSNRKYGWGDGLPVEIVLENIKNY